VSPRPRVRAAYLAFALFALRPTAQAQVVTEFSAGITAGVQIFGITAGPDGNVWFTDSYGGIGRITPLGVITESSAGVSAGAIDITAGSDGNLWFTGGHDRIGRITPLRVVTEFSAGITPGSYPYSIAAGPDGNLWFTEYVGNRIGRITPFGVVTEYGTDPAPVSITAGPDGNMWFTLNSFTFGGRIGRITPEGVVTKFSAGISGGAWPDGITAGPDGNLWFTEGYVDRIGRITPEGLVTEFSTGITAGAGPFGIAAGADGNLWFTELDGNRIGRITPLGVVTEFSAGITAGAHPRGITAGPDGNLWFTETMIIVGFDPLPPPVSRIGRITTSGTVAPPTIVTSFGTEKLPLNSSTSLNFTIHNPNTYAGLTGVGLVDALPTGIVVATPNGVRGGCDGGTIVAVAGSGTVTLTEATLAGSSSCILSVNVTGKRFGTYENITGVTSVEGGSGGTASATLTVGFASPTSGPVFHPHPRSDGH
jgi:streptogramin lyase